jgi:hypothetical protein
MQLAIKPGAELSGVKVDLVVAYYADDADIDMTQHPGAYLMPFTGSLEELDRVGPEPAPDAQFDGRPRKAPPLDLIAYAGARRYMAEVGGMTFNGQRYPTDREASQPKITAAYVKALSNPDYAIESFKVGPGLFVRLDNATVHAIGDAMEAHIQACFDVEKAVSADIASGKVKTVAAVNTAFARFDA